METVHTTFHLPAVSKEQGRTCASRRFLVVCLDSLLWQQGRQVGCHYLHLRLHYIHTFNTRPRTRRYDIPFYDPYFLTSLPSYRSAWLATFSNCTFPAPLPSSCNRSHRTFWAMYSESDPSSDRPIHDSVAQLYLQACFGWLLRPANLPS